MHILFVTGEYPPQTGGVGAYTAELARALIAAGARVSVITGRISGAQSGAGTDGVNLLPVVEGWNPAAMRTVAQQARTLGAALIHVQYQTAAYAMNPSINLAPGYWQRQTRVAWTYHDLLPPYLFPKAGDGARRWVTEYPATHSDAVIATNRGDFARLDQVMLSAHDAGRTSARLHTIPIGSNVGGVQLSASERAARRLRYGWDDDAVVLGYFGALNRSKGATTLLKTLSILVRSGVNAHLLMIGDVLGSSDPTNAQHAEEVREEIARLNLTKRVVWTGRQDAADVSADLNAIDIALLPYADGASLRRGTLMAAIANGCAIITTAPKAPIDELEDGRDLLYVAGQSGVADSQDETATRAAQAVRRLLDDAGFAAHLRAGALRASRAFAWENIAQQHLAIYRQVAAVRK